LLHGDPVTVTDKVFQNARAAAGDPSKCLNALRDHLSVAGTLLVVGSGTRPNLMKAGCDEPEIVGITFLRRRKR
jgi:hypothetical protein